jgi:AcrR family transcriptional regulator
MKAADRRIAIVDTLTDHMLAHGLAASSLRALAKAAGTSDRMLLYYFADKADLVGAALARIAERIVGFMEAQGAREPRDAETVRREVAAIVLSDDLWPYMRIWLELATLSAHGDPLYRGVGEAIGRGFLAWGTAQIDAPDDETRAREAARLLASIEGLVLLKALGLDDVCERAAL